MRHPPGKPALAPCEYKISKQTCLVIVYTCVSTLIGVDMAFQRKSSLGHYTGSRNEWLSAYRTARSLYQAGLDPEYDCTGLKWKAQLIVFNERDQQDPLSVPMAGRLIAKRIIDEILAETRPQ